MPLTRRGFLSGSAAAGVTLAGTGLAQSSVRKLPVIPMLDHTAGFEQRLPLTLAAATHDFGNGTLSDTLGINSSYLGPVIRVKKGQTLPFDVTNSLNETSTLHWHGLHVPGDVDGGPHQEVAPGAVWSPNVPIVQRASMNWFHSHMHGKTAQQTYKGLAGVLLIEDDDSLAADLPKTYGIDDFTLVVQDKVFDGAGKMHYEVSAEVFEEGFVGDTFVVNGAIAPVAQQVPVGLVRLRILNACNARFLTLSMSQGPLTVIASDGGFLASPAMTDHVHMSPGERYEVLVDMASVAENTLSATLVDEEEGPLAFLGNLLGRPQSVSLLTLQGTGAQGFSGTIPNSLANVPAPDPSQATRVRSFELNMGDGDELAALAAVWGNFCGEGGMGINGQPMKMDRIDEEVRKGDLEVWRIAVDDQLHPFHIHGCSFRILTQNGGAPPAYAQGWKDMVHVEEGWSEVLVRFDYDAPDTAPYMYHCHILEHEDCGMMGQFTVT